MDSRETSGTRADRAAWQASGSHSRGRRYATSSVTQARRKLEDKPYEPQIQGTEGSFQTPSSPRAEVRRYETLA